MTKLIALAALIFVGVAGWQLGGRLSSDAIGMALGVLFGIMAGIPASLMVLAARRNEDRDYERPRRQEVPSTPLIVVVAPNGQPVPHRQEGDVITVEATPVTEEVGSWRDLPPRDSSARGKPPQQLVDSQYEQWR